MSTEEEKVETFLIESGYWDISSEDKNELETQVKEDKVLIKSNYYQQEVEIHYFQFEQKKPKGVVFLFHGLGNCAALQATVANPLRKENFEVFAFDQIAHGKSYGGGQLLIYSYKDLYEIGWSFIEKMYEKFSEKFKELPLFLAGTSLGGATIIEMMLNQKNKDLKVSGVILIAPAIISPQKPNFVLQGLLSIASSIYGSISIGSGDVRQMTRVKFEQKRRLNHSDVYPPSEGLPIATIREVLSIMDDIQARINEFNIPMLLMHGKKDEITLISGSELLFDKNQTKNKEFKIYEEGLHALTHDYTALDVSNDMIKWMNKFYV